MSRQLLRSPRAWAPIGILGLGVLIAVVVMATRPELEPTSDPEFAPLVRVTRAHSEPVRFAVLAHGSVVPRSEGDLVPQVSGEVVWVSPHLVAGGFFDEGDVLVRIEAEDYAADVESARAAVARGRSEYARARKERDRQRRLADRSVASQSRIDDAENAFAVAEASLREARARLGRAERDLDRTELRAPYEGRVRSEDVDVGQFLTRGQSYARLYAVDYAEVRLPLPDRELRYLDLSLGRITDPLRTDEAGESAAEGGTEAAEGVADDVEASSPGSGPDVVLRAEFAGRQREWAGRIVRTEGEIDPRSRMLNVVARVADPYGRHTQGQEAPLAVGLFVEAEIAGREVESAFLLPRTALRRDDAGESSEVWVVGEGGRLEFRPVEVLRVERDRVVLGQGLVDGERVVVSPLRGAVDGMVVRIQQPSEPVARVSVADGVAADRVGGTP